MARRSGVYFTSDTLRPALATAPVKLDGAMHLLTEYWAPRVQAHAQQNASWTDQTGNARQGLTARATHEKLKHTIVLFHSMPYGIWLEVRWSGRYAIILPTIRTMGPQVMAGAKRLLAVL